MSAALRNVLVGGATGKQGGATVRHLAKLNSSKPKYNILAVTRDPTTDKAQALSSSQMPNVSVVQGDWNKPNDIFASLGKVHSIFYMIDPANNDPANGKSMQSFKRAPRLTLTPHTGFSVVDAAKAAGIEHFVLSTADWCGTDELPSPRFAIFREIEAHLRTSGLRYTILHPSGFMENALWPTYLQYMAATWHNNIKYKQIAVDDIGYAAATVIDQPEAFEGKDIDLAGDASTADEVWATFKEVTGYVPLTKEMPTDIPPPLQGPFKFWNEHEFAADVEENRKLFPGIRDFKTWLETSPFKK